ncbi:MAG: preprotein translocase subunit SecE [Thermodesulfobacteriota bacterium]
MEKLDRAKKFFTEARAELKKVVWPSKKQTLNSSRVVIIFVVIISIYLGLVDFGLSNLIKYILK